MSPFISSCVGKLARLLRLAFFVVPWTLSSCVVDAPASYDSVDSIAPYPDTASCDPKLGQVVLLDSPRELRVFTVPFRFQDAVEFAFTYGLYDDTTDSAGPTLFSMTSYRPTTLGVPPEPLRLTIPAFNRAGCFRVTALFSRGDIRNESGYPEPPPDAWETSAVHWWVAAPNDDGTYPPCPAAAPTETGGL